MLRWSVVSAVYLLWVVWVQARVWVGVCNTARCFGRSVEGGYGDQLVRGTVVALLVSVQ